MKHRVAQCATGPTSISAKWHLKPSISWIRVLKNVID